MNILLLFFLGAVMFLGGLGTMLCAYTHSAKRTEPAVIRLSVATPGDYEVSYWQDTQKTSVIRVR